jgi:hypothetical protein
LRQRDARVAGYDGAVSRYRHSFAADLRPNLSRLVRNRGYNLLAVIVTQIIQYPRLRGLNMFLVSGKDMDRWFDQAQDLMCKYGQAKGASFFDLSAAGVKVGNADSS